MLKLLFALTFIHNLMNVYLTNVSDSEEDKGRSRDSQKFNPAWMDYCDPYHCNDYWRQACGLNRKTMRFRYFQSLCHLILNNQCADYRGALRYDAVDIKYCRIYTMFLRTSCPRSCDDAALGPLCAMSSTAGQVVLFANECSMNRMNCRKNYFQEYEEVNMRICENQLQEKFNS